MVAAEVERVSDIDWWIWAPVPEYATLYEVQNNWSLDDLCDAHEVMAIRADMEEEARKRAETT